MVPVVEVFFLFSGLDEFQFLFRIIYQGTQLTTLLVADVAGEQLADLSTDVS